MSRTARIRITLVAVVVATASFLGMAGTGQAGTPFEANTLEFTFGSEQELVNFDNGPISLSDAVKKAAGQDLFELDLVEEVSTFDGKKMLTVPGSQIRSGGDAKPSFNFTADKTTVTFADSSFAEYCVSGCPPGLTPAITVTLNKVQDTVLTVVLEADPPAIKVGGTVQFTANVAGPTKLRYSWDFGDGGKPAVGSKSESHKYTKSGSFTAKVTVTDQVSGAFRSSSVPITVRKDKSKKPEEKKPKKKPKKKQPDASDTSVPPGNGGSDGGNGSPVPSPSVPSPPVTTPPVQTPPAPEPKEKKPQQAIDDGLVPVRGELLDPSIPGQVIEPSTDQPGGSEAADPEAGPKGFALSGGAKTALGIAALLGIGGLAEIGSFTRFR